MSSISTDKPSAKSVFWENVQTIALALLLAMAIRFVIAQPFRIPSGSMQPTLLVGDYILVTKWSYGYSRFSIEPLNFGGPHGRIFAHEPKRGDVIVFRPPPDETKDFVKRLIGMPGDRIQVRGSVLYINDKAVPREYLGVVPFRDGQTGDVSEIPSYKETLPDGVSYTTFDREDTNMLDNTDVFTVPAGHYFMMGDDRDNSADSRTDVVGYVPFENLVGHAQFVVVSFDPTRTNLFLPWTWFTGARGDRLFKGVP